ncbi:hypothetical protein JCM11251_006582 [Rhodosporidiobolus azoricus]
MPKFDQARGGKIQNKPYSRPGNSQQRPQPHDDGKPSFPPRRFDPSARQAQPGGRPRTLQKELPKAHSPSLDLSNQPLTAPPTLPPGLTKLNLSNCGLTSLSFVRAAASTLTWLNVSGNDLKEPAAWKGIEELKGLFVLNASHCGLTSVPACIGNLSSLKALVLSHNSLTKLDHVANLPDLNTIVVSNNSLTALPSSLSTLPSLKKISAAHNYLTPSGLPDLSRLSHLHELRLNDNKPLTSLPPHFGSWGKAPLSASSTEEEKRRKGRQGIEILDLGNCGFDSWFGLRELGKQNAVVNLGLKGNKVAEEALEAGGFEDFKSKLLVLLPSLRILDNNRFDAKHAELKQKRASRTEEQKILDAGPMMLAINAAAAAPVKISKELLRERGREKDRKRRRQVNQPVDPKQLVVEGEAEGEGLGEEGEKRILTEEERRERKERKREEKEKRRKEWEEKVKAEEEAAAAATAQKADKGKKRDRTAPAVAKAPQLVGEGAAGAAATGGDVDGAEPARKKKKKNRHEVRKSGDEGAEAAVEGAAGVAAQDGTVEAEADAKRERAKNDEAESAASGAEQGAAVPMAGAKSKRDKKKKGGLLDALRGDPSDSSVAASPSAVPKRASPPPPAAPAITAEEPDKAPKKTSVAKIVDVKKSASSAAGGGKKGKKAAELAAKEEAKRKADLGALLGLGGVGSGEGEKPEEGKGQAEDKAPVLSGWGDSAGSGLFGGGGWD